MRNPHSRPSTAITARTPEPAALSAKYLRPDGDNRPAWDRMNATRTTTDPVICTISYMTTPVARRLVDPGYGASRPGQPPPNDGDAKRLSHACIKTARW